ncbi:MAG: type II secretion system protein [Candidatus Pacebacteria bacterium]|jgi:prepilin-type N-terminal cleavage/methylation domain-containing protein|nr:type II secretion system protein [Candidatus Paceibacterota bacterium]
MKRGFTLIELLVVIAIIGILSSVVLASLNNARLNARTTRSIQDLHSLRTALELYATSNNGTYPVSSGWSGLYSCWGYQGADWIPGLAPAYIPSLPRSPNNSPDCDKNYIYNSNGTDYKLIWHNPEACTAVQSRYPNLVDPGRTCWAYGFWTAGGVWF